MIGTFYVQSAYSMLRSTLSLERIFKHAQTGNYDFIAIADTKLHGLYQILEFSKTYDIQTVVGLEVEVELGLEVIKLLVFAKGNLGLKNLINLSTYIETQSKSLSLEFLATHLGDCFVVTPGIETILENYIQNDIASAYDLVKTLKSYTEDLYLGLSLQSFELEMKVAPKLFEIAEHFNLYLLPTHLTAYLNKDEKEVFDALRQIESSNYQIMPTDLSFYDKEKLVAMYEDYPFIFTHIDNLLEEIKYQHLPTFSLPKYPNKQNVSSKAYLDALVKVGLKKRLKKYENPDEKTYQERLEYELSVINHMGYADYFLIVFDFVRYAKEKQILVGPGRGSAAGSLVSYCLGITEIDPLVYDLLFERFLNPARKTMPDIDMDFPDDRRDEVILYVQDKYGKDKVSTITTFGTFAVRSSVRDIGRVMKIDVKRINRLISDMMADSIDETDQELTHLLAVAKRIEGLPRHTGTHPAGIILSSDSLKEHIPLQMGPHGLYQSQFEASDLEKLGALKIDFLGIRNLSVIDEVLKKSNLAGKLLDFPLDDEKTYKLLSSGQTTGIFQLESSGMRQVIKKLQPKVFEDLVALLALYRPGPMESIDVYVARRSGEKFTYINPILEPILKQTYGIIVYQEQIMQIASQYAGYTLAEADLLRRGVSKKDRDILERERQRFVEKSGVKGHPKEQSEEIYDYIVKFADYGFNRSHSVSYALVAYQMAYLKTHHFATFMSVLLSSVISNEGLLYDYIKEVKEAGILFLPPDIRYSDKVFTQEKKGIRLPLVMIKGLGQQTIERIMIERDRVPFSDFNEFKIRMKSILNEKQMISLIQSGALDCFNLSKKTMYEHRLLSQTGFELYLKDYQMQVYDEYTDLELMEFEKKLYGFNLFYHPLSMYKDLILKKGLKPIIEQTNQRFSFLGMIIKKKDIRTKNQEKMCFLTVSDGDTEIDLTVFPRTYQQVIKDLDNHVFIFHVNRQQGYILDRLEIVK